MKILDVIQGSPEWDKVRCGIPTSSNFDKILTTDGKLSKQIQKYLFRLAGETITGVAEVTYQNAMMQRGSAMEAEARELYRLISSNEVQEVGFCLAEGYGASPDGLVGTDGLLEIKCPSIAVHVEYLLKNVQPIDYLQQIQGQLLVTGRKWCDFFSYYPGLRPFLIRVERNKPFLRSLKVELEIFVEDLKKLVNKIR